MNKIVFNPDQISPSRYLVISITHQTMRLIETGTEIRKYTVSTAKKGLGEQRGSECTPRGWHVIRAKIGASQPLNSVFIARRSTGEIYSAELGLRYPNRDWILTRILWLGGLQPGFNRYGQVDTTWRYIYIHGSPDHLMRGQPESHGCIRMHNEDILTLFEEIKLPEYVLIMD